MHDFSTVRRDSLVRYLQRQIAGEVRFDDTSRRLYATDASLYQVEPLGVVVPKTADDLTATVQIAAELRVPVTARGGGTSLSGQAIGPGIVVDCSKYLNRLVALDVPGRTARVQPGIVLDHLNATLAPHGLMFGPDVAPANRATLGGMIGNNSAGARSVVYGRTGDHVRTLDVVLSDGTPVAVGPLTDREHAAKLELRTREGDAYRAVDRVRREHADEIDGRFPKILRAVSGYNLVGVRGEGLGVSQNPRNPAGSSLTPRPLPLTPHSLVPLLVGSEGTLAVVAGAELNLIPRPKFRGLLVPHFADLRSALDATAVCLEFGPSAIELLDQHVIELARGQRSLQRQMAAVVGTPAALLMAEFSGDDESEIAGRIDKLARRLEGVNGLTACVKATDPSLRDPLWNLRSASMPLLYGLPGDRKPVTFVEDCAVAPERMPEFAVRFRDLLRRHGTDGAFYGHASVGCLHIRPLLDLHAVADVRAMRAITEGVTDLVLEFRGSLSGEHGDGMARSEWNRKMFGPVIYDAFRQIKHAFDPDNVLNPGKIVDGPAMDANLRVPPGDPAPAPPTVFDYATEGGFFRGIEACNGSGVCRKTHGGAMCPSFRATRDERDSTRGRANALRQSVVHGPWSVAKDKHDATGAREGTGRSKPWTVDHGQYAQRWVAEVMDLCLSCKACKAECPSSVDMAKLKAEFQQAYYADRVRPRGHYLVKNIDVLSPLAARWAGTANWLGRRRFVRSLMEATTGIDRRRSLPELHRDHFRRWFSRTRSAGCGTRGDGQHPPSLAASLPRSTVILLDDCFTTFQEPQIGRAAVTLLERAGYRVELANVCCGRAMISKGFVADAREMARKALPELARRVADGTPILGLEPSCVYTLADEWPDLVPGPDADRVAAAAEPVETWLARQAADGRWPLTFAAGAGSAVLHTHCHQAALAGSSGPAAAVRLAPGVDLTVLDAGCCGMAGAFGFEKDHYDLSVSIGELALAPAVRAAGSATVIATGTSCRHQIRDLTGRRAAHPVEFLAGLCRGG